MRKELKDLQGCLCEQEEDTEVLLAKGDYTSLDAIKDKFGLTLIAWGGWTACYKPTYCPFCGRYLRQEGEQT